LPYKCGYPILEGQRLCEQHQRAAAAAGKLDKQATGVHNPGNNHTHQTLKG